MKRAIVPSLIVALIAAIAAALWLDLPGRIGRSRGDARILTLYGNVDIRQVDLGFRVGGRVARMLFDEGDTIAAGAVLAELDRRPFEDSARVARAEIAVKEATLAKLRAGSRVEEIAEAHAVLDERKAALRNAQLAYDRATRLVQTKVTSQASSDDAQAERDGAVARVASAQAALDLLLAGSRAEDIAAAEAALDGARANLTAAETALADTVLAAPADGVILTRVTEPGTIVGIGDTAYVLSLNRPVWVRAYVAEPDLGKIYPGQEVAVVTDSRPERPYKAQIGFISPVAEFTPKTVQTPELRTDLVYRLRVIVSDADQGLRQGMPVTVHVRP